MIRYRVALCLAAFACLLIPGGGAYSCFTWSSESARNVDSAATLPVTVSDWISAAQAGGRIQIWFKGVSLSEFIQSISPMLGIAPLRIDPDVQGSVTIDPGGSISREDLLRQLDKILFENQAVLRKSVAGYRVSRRTMPSSAESAKAKPPKREPVRVRGMDQESRLITRVEPIWPDLARRARLKGTTLLDVTINEQGDVSFVRIMRSGHPLVITAVTDAVEKWHYLPACIDGEAVPVVTNVGVTFDLTLGPAYAEPAKAAQPASEAPVRTPVRVEMNQQAARLVYWVEPEFTEKAREEHLAGTVWLDVSIDELGQVSSVKLVCGSPSVEQTVVDAVRQWRYVPAQINGSAVAVAALVSLPFDLREQ
jgi:TonB family protein